MRPEIPGKELIDQLLYENESSTLDFKEEQYLFYGAEDNDKSELLKDILAFANAWRRSDAFILIGVHEIKGGRSLILGVDHHLNDNDLQQFINSKSQRPITFSYSAFELEGKQIGLIHIPLQNRPLYLAKDFGRLTRNTVYIRRGSATAIATLDEVARMGIDGSPDKTVREPALSVSFCGENNDRKHLKVIAIETLEQSVVLDHLKSIKIAGEELKLVQQHADALNSCPDKYPNGQIYYPYKVDKVFAFIKQLNKSIELVQNDFETFRKRANLFKRKVLLYKPPWADTPQQSNNSNLPRYVITEIFNNGTSPANNVIIYIRSNEYIRFYNFEDLNQMNCTPYNKIPDEIQKIVSMAKRLNEGEITAAQYRLASQIGIGLGSFNYSPPFAPHIPQSTMRVIDLNLQIKLGSMLMHNHKESITESDIYLCPFLEKGQTVNVEYECHSSELPVPQKGLLTFTAE